VANLQGKKKKTKALVSVLAFCRHAGSEKMTEDAPRVGIAPHPGCGSLLWAGWVSLRCGCGVELSQAKICIQKKKKKNKKKDKESRRLTRVGV
jgi:hypothetical protein